ncbi:OmpW/AlkL family protein [Novosphingobium panipatense]|uniref:Outer membrane protein n=1 Tax=Novosphingobium panipatense TaxID=428991 RepID=A0ABY1QW80_9SPHN|nr:OmpW family outer membrane protein [Novosphingobium panipatense]SMP82072.1 outer membrane protein [Novosphingobium panipatense]
MRKVTVLAAALATGAAALATPALAGSPDGKVQVKLLATGVLPDGGIDAVRSIDPALAGTLAGMGVTDVDAKANDNVVPTVAVEYFVTKAFSVETICCFTQHHVNGAADLAGTRLVDHVLILPATITAKFHLDTGGPLKPYLGAGPALFVVFDEKPGSTARALGVDRVKMSNSLGVALQGGIDLALGTKGYGLSLDAKKYFIEPTATFYADGAKVLKTRHDLNPWVVSAGLSYRF